MSVQVQRFLPTDALAVLEHRHGRAPTAHLALVRALMVVRDELGVKVRLQLFERRVDLLAERDLVELVKDCLVEALTDAVGLQ
jgi:hypothetical protein